MAKKNNKKEKAKIKGNNIKKFLVKMGQTQLWLASSCGTNVSHISRIVNGRVLSISLPVAIKISNALKRPIDEIFIIK